jgi:uncharacterized protein
MVPRAREPSQPSPSASICIGCGLCCDGTILSHLAVADESDLGWPLRVLGVEVIVESEPPVFALPCPAVVGGVCTVYDKHRPHACAQFECDLLRAVADDRVTRDAARTIISETIAQRDLVRAGRADPADLADRIRAHFRISPDGSSPAA